MSVYVLNEITTNPHQYCDVSDAVRKSNSKTNKNDQTRNHFA